MTSSDLDPALYAYPEVSRPWVRMNFVASADGAAWGSDGRSGSLGTAADKHAFDLMRRACDVVIVGAGTARTEGYGLADGAVLALASKTLNIPDDLRQPGVIVVAPANSDAEQIARLERDGVDVVRTGADDIDWPDTLAEFDRRGLRKVLCEGGPTLFSSLAAADLVDELCLTIAPVLVGGDGPRIASGPGYEHSLTLAHAIDVEGTLLTRWIRADREPMA